MIPLGVLAARRPASGGSPLTGTFLQTATSTADQSTYTFTGQNIGTAEATRRVIVAVTSRKAPPSANLSSLTIGGVSATIATQIGYVGNLTAIAYALVPTGTTADVVATWSTTVLRCGIGMWAITGGGFTVASNTATGTTPTAAVTSTDGSFTLAAMCSTGSVVTEWSTHTSRYRENIEAFTCSGADSTAVGVVTFAPVTTPATDSIPLAVAAFNPA